MKQNNVTASITPDKRYSKKTGTFPLKLRITYKGARKYYATGHDIDMQEWELIQKGKVRAELKKKAFALSEIQVKAQKCCDELERFSFSKFETAFFPKVTLARNVKTGFDNYIAHLTKNGQIGSANAYTRASVSLHKYKPRLKFEDVTPEFLRNYERWFVGQKKSITTVGIYLRTLRAIINVAIEQGVMDRADYPFGKRKLEESKNYVAQTANATLTFLYWKIGRRINVDVLKNKRAEYGKQIVASLTRQLTEQYGNSYSDKNIRRMMQFADVFPNEQIVVSAIRQLSWIHFITLIPLKGTLQREFYAEMCRVEKWTVKILREKIESILYERAESPSKKILQQKFHKAIELSKQQMENK